MAMPRIPVMQHLILMLMVWTGIAAAVHGVTNDPSWVINHPSFDQDMVMTKTGKDSHFNEVVDREYLTVKGATDGEKIDLVEKFFWGMEKGTIIELGAVSGGADTDSQSLIFEEFGWRRILLEGSPMHRAGLATQTNAFSANVAMCKNGTVHYSVSSAIPMTSGILEFMPPKFMKQYHREIYNLVVASSQAHDHSHALESSFDVSSVDWNKLAHLEIISVPCVQMDTVLEVVGVTHVNAFILDVEGAEPHVLRSIDFNKIKFDVIVIERNQPKDVKEFMSQLSDYEYVTDRGRNMWYKHVNYVPSVKPGLSNDCYRGCAKAGIIGCPKHCPK